MNNVHFYPWHVFPGAVYNVSEGGFTPQRPRGFYSHLFLFENLIHLLLLLCRWITLSSSEVGYKTDFYHFKRLGWINKRSKEKSAHFLSIRRARLFINGSVCGCVRACVRAGEPEAEFIRTLKWYERHIRWWHALQTPPPPPVMLLSDTSWRICLFNCQLAVRRARASHVQSKRKL